MPVHLQLITIFPEAMQEQPEMEALLDQVDQLALPESKAFLAIKVVRAMMVTMV
jgi:hypothetical protein